MCAFRFSIVWVLGWLLWLGTHMIIIFYGSDSQQRTFGYDSQTLCFGSIRLENLREISSAAAISEGKPIQERWDEWVTWLELEFTYFNFTRTLVSVFCVYTIICLHICKHYLSDPCMCMHSLCMYIACKWYIQVLRKLARMIWCWLYVNTRRNNSSSR